LAQEASQPPEQKVELLASDFVRSHQQAMIRRIVSSRRSTHKLALPSNCSNVGALCPVW
jgi:hypothetical protein